MTNPFAPVVGKVETSNQNKHIGRNLMHGNRISLLAGTVAVVALTLPVLAQQPPTPAPASPAPAAAPSGPPGFSAMDRTKHEASQQDKALAPHRRRRRT